MQAASRQLGFRIHRTTCDKIGNVIEFGRSLYRGYCYIVALNRLV